MFLTAA